MDYDEWMRFIDDLFDNIFGVDADTFEDWTWMEAYDLGKTPKEAFEKWAEETGHSEFI